MAHLGIGPEQFGVASMVCGLDEVEEPQPITQEVTEHQAIEPDRQQDIVITSITTTSEYAQVPAIVTDQAPAKRKYTKRAK
jgi:hypothetical protein